MADRKHYPPPLTQGRDGTSFTPKCYEQHRVHFIDRLRERYGIELSLSEYDARCTYEYINENFKGKLKKGMSTHGKGKASTNKTIGILNIKGTDVIVLYNPIEKSLDTCYPPGTLENIEELIHAYFISPLRPMAREMYNYIIEKCNEQYVHFDNIDQAGIYFFTGSHEILFPHLLIARRKHGQWNLVMIVRMIARILYGKHNNYSMDIKIKKDEKIQTERQ